MEHTRTLSFVLAGFLSLPVLHAQLEPSWARSFTGPGPNAVRCVSKDAYSQYTFVAGDMNGTIDLLASPGGGELSATGNAAYVARFNAVSSLDLTLVLTSTGMIEISDVFGGGNTIVITGTFSGSLQYDPSNTLPPLNAAGGTDAFIATYFGDGIAHWGRSIGGPGNDAGRSICVDPTANVYFAGTFQDDLQLVDGGTSLTIASNGGDDVMAGYFGYDGSPVWLKGFGGPNDETVGSIDAGNNGMAMVGSFSGTMDADPGPDVNNLVSQGGTDIFYQFFTNYGSAIAPWGYGGIGDDRGVSIAFDTEFAWLFTANFSGTVSFDGGMNVLTSTGGTDVAVVCRNTWGLIFWAKQFGGSGDDQATALAAQDFYHYAVAGNFSDADMSTGATLTNMGGSDIFMLILDADGLVLESASVGSPADEHCNDANLDQAGWFAIAGDLNGDLDVDPSASTLLLSALDPSDAFVAVYDAGSVQVNELNDASTGTPYPNPAHDRVYVPVKEQNGTAEVSILDAIGRTVATQQLNVSSGSLVVDVSTIANGTYLLDLRFNDGSKKSFHVVVNK